MSSFLIRQIPCVKGEVNLAGDKSIAHRSIIVSAISPQPTTIENFPTNKDCLYTVSAFKKLGVRIITPNLKTSKEPTTITVLGKGLYGLRKPKGPIFVGNSGTTLRLLLGVLAGQDFRVKLVTGKSLSQRPMLRVTKPLRMMGADIIANRKSQIANRIEEYPPIAIRGGRLKPITYKMPVASAQVKSAILLAGLYTKGKTRVIEYISTRDHTERMLKLFKADIKVNPSTALCFDRLSIRPERAKRVEGLRVDGERSRTIKENKIVIKGNQELVSPKKIYIPGDISSASFFMVLAAILPDSQILIRNVSLNPSRTGIIRVLKRMGADIRVSCLVSRVSCFEPMGDIRVKSSKLKGTIVRNEEIPSLIDELPILMVAACFACGRTIFKGVGELRVKETDRIKSMSENLAKMGGVIQVLKTAKKEGIVIQGVKELHGSHVRSFADHRTAMSMVVAGLKAQGKTWIDDIACINKSFPNFLNLLRSLKNS